MDEVGGRPPGCAGREEWNVDRRGVRVILKAGNGGPSTRFEEDLGVFPTRSNADLSFGLLLPTSCPVRLFTRQSTSPPAHDGGEEAYQEMSPGAKACSHDEARQPPS